jgi:2Fe-2S ferredoxin
MKESIKVFVQHPDGKEDEVEIPLGVSLSLMEVLKGEGYPIEATCGGMALCATCRVEV